MTMKPIFKLKLFSCPPGVGVRLSIVTHAVPFLWPPNGIGQVIIFCPVVSSSFFPAYSQLSKIWCLQYFHTWCGLSANLGCRSETCCRRSLKIQDAKIAKKLPFGHHRTTLSDYIFAYCGQTVPISATADPSQLLLRSCILLWTMHSPTNSVQFAIMRLALWL